MIHTVTEKISDWKESPCDPNELLFLSEQLSVHSAVARLFIRRGLRSLFDAKRFLSPSIDLLHNPFLFEGMDRAVSRILAAMERGEKILIYGDYDVDGMTGTALLVELFRLLGYPVPFYIPDRLTEGYGLHAAALEKAASGGTTLVITSDCGSTAHAEVAEAARLGIDVIVTDHHRLEGAPPPVTALLNPYLPQRRPYPFTGLASVGVGFKLAEALFERCGLSKLGLRPLLDLAALGTVADVAPLTGENRYLVKEGLAVIREGGRPGLAALLRQTGEDPFWVNERTLAYGWIPRLNAAGRLYHANEGVRLLTAAAPEEAAESAARLDGYNRERQEKEAKIWEEAERQASGSDPVRPPALVLASEGWHPGIVGIIASRLVERYQRPAIVIALSSDGIGRGSGRSAGGIDLHRAVSACRPLLEKFGGHAGAIGLTIRRERIDSFRQALGEVLAGSGTVEGVPQETFWIDAQIRLKEITFQFLQQIEALAPFGPAHPEPLFAVNETSVVSVRREAGRPPRFKIRDSEGWTFDVAAPRHLRLDAEACAEGALVDLVFTPERGRLQGEERIFLRLKAIQRTKEAPRC